MFILHNFSLIDVWDAKGGYFSMYLFTYSTDIQLLNSSKRPRRSFAQLPSGPDRWGTFLVSMEKRRKAPQRRRGTPSLVLKAPILGIKQCISVWEFWGDSIVFESILGGLMDSWWFVRTVRLRGCTFPRNLMEFEVWNSSRTKINSTSTWGKYSFTHCWGCLHFQPHKAHASYPKKLHVPPTCAAKICLYSLDGHKSQIRGTEFPKTERIGTNWWLVGYIRIGWVHCQSVDDSNLILKIEKYVVYVGFVFNFVGGV